MGIDVLLGNVSSKVKQRVRAGIPKDTTKTMGLRTIFHQQSVCLMSSPAILMYLMDLPMEQDVF